MPKDRPSRTPGSRGAGRTPRATTGRAGSRPGSRPVPRTPRTAGTTARPAPDVEPTRRPRLTGRAAVLVLVLAVLMVSYASSMRAFFEQREQLAGLRADIAESKTNIKELEREEARWEDPAYVAQQARLRLGWVQPGDIGLQVLDENGKPMGTDTSLEDAELGTPRVEPEWYETAWGSVVAAGLPTQREDNKPTPASKIRAPKTKQ